ncbi:DUF3300 domain-containing protein [Thalassomonas haliotis]|uniref:DUF3300 domain-containing protein n=1 Tax=Thalassomonas haliotis TaxID=485448 RepID=A0ABY7VAV6_9GAMM|nr:DUF3300 domain-containing protein [Thalassomonas haliotis]WDE10209.1 DUF3300 domain-containing protein [Thalassomonas haliotis]
MKTLSPLFYSLVSVSLLLNAPPALSLAYSDENSQSRETSDVRVEAVKHFTEAELAQILAPIALYPDTILSHILIAATYPLEVIQAERWVSENPDLSAEDSLEQVEEQSWDASVKALVPFPQILERLSDDLDWTEKLGDAFLQDEAKVLASIQTLRQQAQQAGNLDNMDNMEVSHEDNNIIIQPIEKEVVYVPYYDTRVVYGNWHWAHHPPVYWDFSWHSGHRHHYGSHHGHYGHHYSRHHGLFSWHPGVHISFHHYFSTVNWHHNHLVVLKRRHYTRGYYHRNDIIRHYGSKRWHHNPIHRRGAAYRSHIVKERYHSSRPSKHYSVSKRKHERQLIASQGYKRSQYQVNKQLKGKTSNKVKNKALAVNRSQKFTRQQKLTRQLKSGQARELKSLRATKSNYQGNKSNRQQTIRTTKHKSGVKNSSSSSYKASQSTYKRPKVRSNASNQKKSYRRPANKNNNVRAKSSSSAKHNAKHSNHRYKSSRQDRRNRNIKER